MPTETRYTRPARTVETGYTLAAQTLETGYTRAALEVETGYDAQPAAPTAPVNTVAPVVSGTTTEGETLTCTDGTWTGTLPITYAYQWYRTSGPGFALISGATSSTYLLDAADVGEQVRCVVTATNVVTSVAANSNTVGPIASAGTAPVNTVAPAVTGFVAVGQTLTTTDGTWTGTPTPTYTYQWQRDTGSGWADISGKTASTYVVDATSAGSDVRCVVTASNGVSPDASEPSNTVASPIKTILADARLVEIRTARGNADVYYGLDAATNGDPVGSWTGHKGLAATQAITGAKPTRVAGGVDFDGTDDRLSLSSTEVAELAAVGWTVLVAIRDNPSPTTNRIIWGASNNGTGLDVVNMNSAGDVVKALSGAGTVVVNLSNWTAPNAIWLAVEGTGTNLTRLRQLGVDTSYTFGAYPTTIDRAAIGCRPVATPVLFHDGTISCFAVFSAALSHAEMAAYEAILTTAGVL
jgi:hypothetical protein